MNRRNILHISLAGLLLVETVLFIINLVSGIGIFAIWYVITLLSALFLLDSASKRKKWSKLATIVWLSTWYIGPWIVMLVIIIPDMANPNRLFTFPEIEFAIDFLIIKSFIIYIAVLIASILSDDNVLRDIEDKFDEHSPS